jgi:hypothetical protein
MPHGNRDLDYLKRISSSCLSIQNERKMIKSDDDFINKPCCQKGFLSI